jgi:hypothetical protein
MIIELLEGGRIGFHTNNSLFQLKKSAMYICHQDVCARLARMHLRIEVSFY